MTEQLYSEMTIDQLQGRYSDLATEISNALEEKHRIFEEILDRTEPRKCGDDHGCGETPCICRNP